MYGNDAKFNELLGVTLVGIKVSEDDDEIRFIANDGRTWRLLHHQDCCESVRVEEVVGDLSDLVGSPLVEAEEVDGETGPEPEYADSYTWTFYKLRTAKGAVTLRWLGESNGCYSESVDFVRD